MAKLLTTKRLQVDHETRSMVITVAIATFITIFAIIAGHNLATLMSYQNRVIGQQSTALSQLTQDLTAQTKLESSYDKFNNTSTTNLLGGPTTGSGQNTGDNAKIVLDALPSAYDFPAMITSVEYLLTNQGVTINSIGGTDTSGTGASASSPSGTSVNIGNAVGMPFTFTVVGPYQNIQNVISQFEKSIRPFLIQTISISGDQTNLTLTVAAEAFYQPATSFNLSTETVQ